MTIFEPTLRPFGEHAAQTVLCLDFDGTLTQIVSSPELASPPPIILSVLGRLTQTFRAVYVISGRPASFLKQRLPVASLNYMGLYGVETVVGGEIVVASELALAQRDAVQSARADLEQHPDVKAANAFIENKGLAVAVHMRNVRDRAAWEDRLKTAAFNVAERHNLGILAGRAVWELQPRSSMNKGTAIRKAVEASNAKNLIVVGDDSGDLPAFRAALELRQGGLSTLRVAVRSDESPAELLQSADIIVEGPEGVIELLMELAATSESQEGEALSDPVAEASGNLDRAWVSNAQVRQLPPDVDLVGREAQLRFLRATVGTTSLVHRSASISVITGTSGVGKSALAIHLAHEIESKFDSTFYYDLERRGDGMGPWDPEYVLRDILSACGVAKLDIRDGVDALAGQFRALMEKRHSLIVLDNASDHEQVKNLVPANPRCHVIITSRVRLTEFGQPSSLVPLQEEFAIELFFKSSGRAIPPIQSSDWQAAAKIVRYCGYLPIAIKPYGARLASTPTWSVEALSKTLRESIDFVTPVRDQEALSSSFMLWYSLLSMPERILFRRLSVIPGASFESGTVAQIAECTLAEAGVLLANLDYLQLIQGTADEQYYQMHSLHRRFAWGRLEEEEGPTSRISHLQTLLDYNIEIATQADRALQPQVPRLVILNPQGPLDKVATQEHLDWFAAERLNLVALIEQACTDGLLDRAWRLADRMAGFFEIRGEWANWEDTYSVVANALASVTPAHNVGLATMKRGLGRLYRERRMWELSLSNYREALVLFRMTSSTSDVGMALLSIGDVHRYLRNWNAAINCLERSLAIFELAEHNRGRAIAMRSIGAVRRHFGEYDEAERLCNSALAVFESIDDERWVAATRLSLADIYLDRGWATNTQKLLEASIPVFERLGDRRWLALTLRSLGDAFRVQGKYDEAMRALQRSHSILLSIRDVAWTASAEHSIGLVHLSRGLWPDALGAFNGCLAAFIEVGDTLWEAKTYVSIAESLRLADAPRQDVRIMLERAWSLFLEQGAADLEVVERLLNAISTPRVDEINP